jgi:predicted nucleotidyltransferase component of viral defense system
METIIKNWFNERQRAHASLLRDLLIEVFRRRTSDLVFKGGTAISFFYGSDRFSEDIDLASPSMENYTVIDDAIESFEKKYSYRIMNAWEDEIYKRPRFRQYRLVFKYGVYEDISASIDYSLDRCITDIEKRDLANDYYAAKITLMGSDEILAEKVRAIYTRQKGRDLYDLHYLSAIRKARISRSMIDAKMKDDPTLKGRKYSFNSFKQRIEGIKPYWGDLKGLVYNFDSINFDSISGAVLDIFRNI